MIVMAKKLKTAAELLTELNINPDYKRFIKDKEQERYKTEEQLRNEEFDIIAQLKNVGLNVSSVWDLVNAKYSYPNAINILINNLQIEYDNKIKEGIIRALSVKEAIGLANPALIEEYNRIPKEEMLLRWTIGNTIYTTITEDSVDSILPIVQDKTNGMSRQMFVLALGKLKSEKAENVLICLLDDDEVIHQALEALGKMKSKGAKDKIAMLTNHPKAAIRKRAKNVLKKVL
jgi:hypothetical protein